MSKSWSNKGLTAAVWRNPRRELPTRVNCPPQSGARRSCVRLLDVWMTRVASMVGPLLHLDAPCRRFGIEKGHRALRAGEAPGNKLNYIIDEGLGSRKYSPVPRSGLVNKTLDIEPRRASILNNFSLAAYEEL